MTWQTVAFSEAFKDVTAKSPRVKQSEFAATGTFPVRDQGEQDVAGYWSDSSAATKVTRPLILFGDHTRRVKYAAEDFVIGADGVKVLDPSSQLDPRFAFYWMRSIEIPSAGYSRHFKFLREYRVPVPPLPEQRRIAAILDHVEYTRESQRKQLQQLDAALRSYIVRHIRPLPRDARVDDLGSVQLGRQRAPKYSTGAHTTPYLRVANVFEDRIDTSDVLGMDFNDRDRRTFDLRYGDILLNEGQSTELVGRPAIWRDEIDGCCFQNTLIRFRPDPERCLSEFAQMVFLGWLWNADFQRVSSKTSNMAHLGASRFASMPFPAARIAVQRRHADFYTSIRAASTDARNRLAQLDALFASLQHRAFRGEL